MGVQQAVIREGRKWLMAVELFLGQWLRFCQARSVFYFSLFNEYFHQFGLDEKNLIGRIRFWSRPV